LVGILVNITVNLDNQSVTEAYKIDNKKLDGVLSPKFSTQAAGPQLLPQHRFGGRGGFAVFASVGFGLVSGVAIGGVNMFVWATEVHGAKVASCP
jgi:hypothetical protein